MPSRVLKFKTLIDVLFLSLSLSFFVVPPLVFGCVCFIHLPISARGKLDPRGLMCIFLRYSPTQKGYRCYHPPKRKRFVSMDVTFL